MSLPNNLPSAFVTIAPRCAVKPQRVGSTLRALLWLPPSAQKKKHSTSPPRSCFEMSAEDKVTKMFLRRSQTQETQEWHNVSLLLSVHCTHTHTHANSNNRSVSSEASERRQFDCETCRMFPACLRALSHRALLPPQSVKFTTYIQFHLMMDLLADADG